MLNIIFNIIGIIFVIYAVLLLKNNFQTKNTEVTIDKKEFEEILKQKANESRVNYDLEKQVDFKEILNSEPNFKEQNMELYNKEKVINKKPSIVIDKSEKTVDYSDEDVKTQVMILKSAGLTNQQVAKKLNKGIREIEIILKVNNIK